MKPFFSSILGTILYPVYNDRARKRCIECEPFVKKGSKILDLGCGHAIIGLALKDYFQAEVLGADIVDQRVVNVPFELIDKKTLPFPSNYFDIVFIAHVLHHTKNYLNVLKEAKRVSKEKIIIYEDLPEGRLSNLFCKTHGFLFNIICMFDKEENNFKPEDEWLEIFNSLDLKIIHKKRLRVSRLFPIKYIQFVLAKNNKA